MTPDHAREQSRSQTDGRPAADPASYELAYEEAKRALEEQERAVSELRSRAGQLIAAAAITTSFFGGRAIGSTSTRPAGPRSAASSDSACLCS